MRSRSESLLPTPIASDSEGARRHTTTTGRAHRGTSLGVAIEVLLPTPIANLGSSGPDYARAGRAGSGGDGLANLPAELFPTPIVSDANGVGVVEWGKYAAAVERAEDLTGIPAPMPALFDGKEGKPRLHDRFVEWMMLLLPGWVCDHGLTRQKALERLGNGVVPLQAAAATATNLTRLAAYKRALGPMEVAA